MKSWFILIFLVKSLILSSQYIGAGVGMFVTIKKNESKIKFASGDVHALKNLKTLNIKYDYEYMAVCSFTSEQDYLNDITKKHNEKKADKLIEEWKWLPKNVLEPKFEEAFNQRAIDIGLKGSNNFANQQATLIVKILKEDPHYHRGDSRPFISFECTFLDHDGYFIARFNIMASGSHESNVGDRLGECYKIAGKLLARELIKS